jgi:GTPase SAR1 family protein
MTFPNLLESMTGVWPALAGAILSMIVSWIFARKNIPRSYRVAVVGFPQAGKTSLITALFAYLFRNGIRGASIVARGEETITRINAHIADMESGVGVAPTRDQDLFAYRAEVQFRSVIAFLSTRYKLEIGDFPGEQTQAFVESENPWLHNTNYFQWAMGADAFIFVVDSEKAIANRDNYVAKQKSAFRAAWQRIQEHHIDGSIRLSRKPVILVYSKADKELGIFFTEKNVEKFQSELDEKFADLIDYFRQDAKRFQTVLISVVLENRSERLGIAKLASYVLPRSTYL